MFGVAKGNIGDFCNSAAGMLQYVGYVILILRIAIPIIIFLLGIFDLGKAVVASKEDETKTAVKRLVWRLIAGIAIFFLPSLIIWLFSTINKFDTDANSLGFDTCKSCLLQPSSTNCTQYIKE